MISADFWGLRLRDKYEKNTWKNANQPFVGSNFWPSNGDGFWLRDITRYSDEGLAECIPWSWNILIDGKPWCQKCQDPREERVVIRLKKQWFFRNKHLAMVCSQCFVIFRAADPNPLVGICKCCCSLLMCRCPDLQASKRCDWHNQVPYN